MTIHPLPLLYDRHEAASLLRTTPETIDRLVDKGLLPSVQLLPGEPPRFRPEDLVYLVDTGGDEQAQRIDSSIKEAVAASRATPEALTAIEQFEDMLDGLGPEDLVYVVDPVGDEQIQRAAAQAAALKELHELLDGLPELTRLVDGELPGHTVDDLVDAATQTRVIDLWVRSGLFPNPNLPSRSDNA